ncbi:MAG TPA: hypothetical protein VJ570_14350 [Holophagaceae bacterium]|nr:hypothetical protein [Holophagaceae bacterium]
MRPHEAERLLGGYATGTLTEAERSALFTAALAHQEVFDALMDEEALRELLADPATRAQLLAALAEPAKVVPFWRRHPGALGLAASLLIAVTAGVAYLRTPPPPIALPAPPMPAPPSSRPAEVPAPLGAAPAAPALDKAPRRRTAPPAAAPEEAVRSVPDALPEAPAPKALPTPPPPPPPVAKAREMEAIRAQSAVARESQAKRKAEAQVQGFVSPSAAAGAPAAATADQANVAPGAALAERVAPAQPAPKATGGPTWSLEAEGKVLAVHHPTGHAVILLRRSPRGPVQVRPRTPAPGEGGLTRFDLGADPGPWDLYVLPKAVTDPLLLPERGPFEGYRARIPAAEPPVR